MGRFNRTGKIIIALVLCSCTPAAETAVDCTQNFTAACVSALENLDRQQYPLTAAYLAGAGCRQGNKLACTLMPDRPALPAAVTGERAAALPPLGNFGTADKTALAAVRGAAEQQNRARQQKTVLLITAMTQTYHELDRKRAEEQLAAAAKHHAAQSVKNQILIKYLIVDPAAQVFVRSWQRGQQMGKKAARQAVSSGLNADKINTAAGNNKNQKLPAAITAPLPSASPGQYTPVFCLLAVNNPVGVTGFNFYRQGQDFLRWGQGVGGNNIFSCSEWQGRVIF